MGKAPRWEADFFRGTPLRDPDLTQRRVLTVESRPNAQYAWDTGIGIGRYLAGLREGRIIASRCGKCRRVVVPPRVVCEHCFLPMRQWVPVQDTGTVRSYSICHVAWNAERLQTPELPVVIELDGASPGVGILHVMGETRPEDIRIGLRVQAMWKPRRQRTGAITDIRHFRPLAKQ